ncbi:MAG: hypothetical protein HC851_08630 [Acaryochloris sp. RU_4_1]|nr:hypothetical protein [Acaryochloris sp. RU_4_1]
MTNNEESRLEDTQSQAQMISPMVTPSPQEQAVGEFERIKQALAGSQPEWCLPRLDPKTKVSDPKLVEELSTCQTIILE